MITDDVLASLTLSEREVLELIATGAQNKEIAIMLGKAPGTIKVHAKAAFRKIGARNRTHAAALVLSRNVVQERGTADLIKEAVAWALEFAQPVNIPTLDQAFTPPALRLVE